MHPGLPIYAGGLGILAGDYIKAARNLGMPMVAVGILWRQDYTEQYIGEDGYPYDKFPQFNFDFLKDTGVRVNVKVWDQEVALRVLLADQYANVPLYLLDAGFPGSPHAWITSKLYDSKTDTRIAQEIVLGIGGVRALEALGQRPDVYHFNEGHAVLAGIELIRKKKEEDQLTFAEAWEDVRNHIVFTTHTPVEAGNEKHQHDLMEKIGAYNGLTYQEMRQIGEDPFNMTIAAMRLSTITNAVSKLHGQTTREMWCEICGEHPIISITNGVHINTWQAKKIRDAFDSGRDLWEPHQEMKRELLDYVQEKKGVRLREDSLLIGFARRAAPYKRSDLIFSSTETIEKLMEEGKLQLLFSGKAHPNDHIGKNIISNLVQMERRYPKNVVFLENYDMAIAQLMVKGCDVWLNNPVRPLEASGTSGMKAAMNGVINLSVVDGWVAEGPQHGISGWLIDQHSSDQEDEVERNRKDLLALYRILEKEVLPTYYEDRRCWTNMMYASIDMSHWQFSSSRMVLEYYNVVYQRAQPQHREHILFMEPEYQK